MLTRRSLLNKERVPSFNLDGILILKKWHVEEKSATNMYPVVTWQVGY